MLEFHILSHFILSIPLIEEANGARSLGIIYATSTDSSLLDKAITALLASLPDEEKSACHVLQIVQYSQSCSTSKAPESEPTERNKHVISFPDPSLGLSFDETIFDQVRLVWTKILGDEASNFLVFADREGEDFDDEEQDTM
jgi:hypothetical protein